MKIELLRCTNCGYDIDRMPEGSFVTCGACGATNVVEIAAEFAKVEVDRSGDIRNLRTVLKRALGVNDIDGIVSAAGKVLELIPDDYAARYYYAYACGAKGVNKYISGFYADPPGVCTEEELQGIAEHINIHSDLRDKAAAEGYLERLDDGGKSLREYREQYLIRAREEDNYDVYERDIFVCHRSTDKEIVERAVSVLERDGNTCWVSYRNLRPNDSYNYWHNIEANMRECKVFLVISSGDAMMSGDVRRELMIARGIEHLRRVEYKIDDEPHTSAFKDFFRGRKWIDGCGADNKCYQSLSRRIFTELKEVEEERFRRERASSPEAEREKAEEERKRIEEERARLERERERAEEERKRIEEERARLEQERKKAEEERKRKEREFEAERQRFREESARKAAGEEFADKAREAEQEKRRLEGLKTVAGAAAASITGAPAAASRPIGLLERARMRADNDMFGAAKEIFDNAGFAIKKGVLVRYQGSGVNVIIPNSVKSIGEAAFEDCVDIKTVLIHDKVIDIGQRAFAKCGDLQSVTIPKKVKEIQEQTFLNCYSLKAFVIPNGVTSIGDGAFLGCDSLESVIVPDSVTSIGRFAFAHCAVLKTLVIPESVKNIGTRAFARFRGNQTIYFRAKAAQFPTKNWDMYWKEDCNAKIVWGYTGK